VSARVIERPAEVVVEVPSRWDAVDLTHRLPSCRWFIVERDEHCWEVHVSPAEGSPQPSPDLAGLAEAWAERRLGAAVRVALR
jgi:hypothetical protein